MLLHCVDPHSDTLWRTKPYERTAYRRNIFTPSTETGAVMCHVNAAVNHLVIATVDFKRIGQRRCRHEPLFVLRTLYFWKSFLELCSSLSLGDFRSMLSGRT